jgi:hypothetical protein
MSFDWMDAKPRDGAVNTTATREDEILARATLLARLGYTKKRIEARVKQNLAWEYEQVGAPIVAKRVAALITEGCRRAGLAQAPAAAKRR